MKTKIEIEVDIPEGQEFDKFEPLLCQTLFGDIAFTGIAKLKPIEPPLELETFFFTLGNGSFNDQYFTLSVDVLKIGINTSLTPAEARDLAKILNYYAEKGKLPDRVVVKSND